MIFFISIFPIFFICFLIYFIDKEKEPFMLLIKLLFLGMLSCIPIIIFELLLERYFPINYEINYFVLFINIFISVAMIEEFFKLLFTYLFCFNHHAFNNLYDMIIYATFVSMGFAFVENIFYLVSVSNAATIGILRALFSIPGHACFGIVMGYYLGMAKLCIINGISKKSKLYSFLSLLIPTLMHTFYNFCLFTNNSIFLTLFVVYIIIIYVICFRKVKFTSKICSNFK